MSPREARPRSTHLPVRTQLLLPITVALIGLLVLGVIHTAHSWRDYQAANDARALSELAQATNLVLRSGQAEITNAISMRNRELDVVLEELWEVTDAAGEYLDEIAPNALERFPALTDRVERAQRSLLELPQARETFRVYAAGESEPIDPEVQEAFTTYRTVADSMVHVGNALHGQSDNVDVANSLEALSLISESARSAGEMRFRLGSDLELAEQGLAEVDPERLAGFAVLAGKFDQQLDSFNQLATPESLNYFSDHFVDSPEVSQAQEAIGVYLSGHLPVMNPGEWESLQANLITTLHDVEDHASEQLDARVDDMHSSAVRSAVITVALITILAATSIFAATTLARRIARRVEILREEALTGAYEVLPKYVDSFSSATSAEQVDKLLSEAKGADVAPLPPRRVDEIDSLSEAFTAAQQQALKQTANQALLRLDVQAMMKTLARRGQGLVRRQQDVIEAYVDKYGATQDISDWRQIYHLLSRMRRNEENLLLMAGGQPGSRYHEAVDLRTVVSDAADAIEDASRVTIDGSSEVYLQAKPAGDLVRILSELLDNAASFSPPKQSVRVAMRHTSNDTIVTVSDDGIGLTPDQLADINRRLEEPEQLTSELTATMGLLVVGRLAALHGMHVQLHSTSGKGTLAMVRVPNTLLPSRTHSEILRRTQTPAPTRLALSAHAANLPVVGTGQEVEAPGAIDPIVPDQPRPVTTPTAPVSHATSQPEVGRARGNGGAGGVVSSSVDVTFKKVDRTLNSGHRTDRPGGLPRRDPGTLLVPGSVPAQREESSVDLDPEEVRDRLSGFASGIAAAEHHE
ncbi:sensor histidine kinase [Natronoglycomyces albus]|uniref:histidine kinase n=1 Tax=Natronoglycomyces albus TaxID=2811108 RepID=A0A895XQ96_9ACTN|nr:sensor histidine kinase [Natronoglycomyces albus]QSB05892.1 sensor histidine kinase [Natronoglycomyces albus]